MNNFNKKSAFHFQGVIPGLLCMFLLAVQGLNAQLSIIPRQNGNWGDANTWESANLTGQITFANNSAVITGTGTLFTTEVAVGDLLYRNNGNLVGTVLSIQSDLSLTLSSNAASNGNGIAYKIGRVPKPLDNVSVTQNFTVTVNSGAFSCATLTIAANNAANLASLVFNAGGQVTVAGTVTLGISGNNNRKGSIDMGSGGTLVCAALSVPNTAAHTFTPGLGTVKLTAGNTLPSTIFTTFNNLDISAGTTVFGAAKTISGNLKIGGVANLGTFTSTANTLTLNGAGQIAGTWGSTSSLAVNTNNTYFAATTGILNVVASSCVPPTALTYTNNQVNYCLGSAISPNSPTYSGNTATLFAVSPALPLGLTLSANTGIISGTPLVVAASGNYTVTVTNNCGATTTTIALAVNALPVPEISGLPAICSGITTELTASGGVSYAWSTGATTAAINVAVAGTYTVTATNASGCTASATHVLVVNPLPAAGITVGDLSGNVNNDGIICEGASATLTGTGGISYVWNTTANTPGITVTAAGTYTVTVTDLLGCTASTTTTITVNPLPVAAITGNLVICSGNTTTLTASGGTSYAWDNGASTAAIIVGTAGPFTVTVTDANACAVATSTQVTVNDLPVPVISGNTVICAGSTTTLTASGGTSYMWDNGATTAEIIVSTAGPFTVTVTNANACAASTSTQVTVNPLPTASASASPAIICAGNSSTLTATGGTAYVWSTGASTAEITVTPASTTTYLVTVTDANGCVSSTSTSVTVNPLPVAVITANGPTTFCAGGSVILSADNAAQYLWSPGGATTQSVTVTQNGAYTVAITDANGCVGTSSATIVTVNPTPTAVISGNPVLCGPNASTTLTASGGETYLWSTGASTAVISVSTAGTYTVTVTGANNCTATASATTTVVPIPTPSITAGGPTTFCAGGSVVLTSSAGDTYLWSTGATTQSITANTAGTYTVAVTTNGCTGTSTGTVVTVNPLPAVTITPAGPTTICSGNTAVLSSSAATGNVWSTGATTQSITVSTAGTYTVTVTNIEGCTKTATTTVTVVTPGANTITSNPLNRLICEGGNPTGFVATGVAGATYQWQYSQDGGMTWTNATGGGGVQTQNYNIPQNGVPGSPQVTTLYKRLATVNGCTTSSNIATVFVNTISAGTVVNPLQLICTGGTINTIDATPSIPVSGPGLTTSVSYRWQVSTTGNSGWTNIAGAAGAGEDYTPTGLTATRYYRRIVSVTVTATGTSPTSVSCSNVPATWQAVVAVNNITPGNITNNNNNSQTICAGDDPQAFVASASTLPTAPAFPAGSTVTRSYKWQSRALASINPWVDVPSSNFEDLNLGAGVVFTSTEFRRIDYSTMTLGTGGPSVTCEANANGGPATIIALPAATANAGNDVTVCYSATPSVQLSGAIGGSATTGTWTASVNGGSFSPNATTLNAVYTPPALTPSGVTITLTLTTNNPAGPCGAVSDAMVYTVLPRVNPGAIAANIPLTLCYNSDPDVINSAVDGSSTAVPPATLSYIWEQSPDGSVWTVIAGANGSTYDPPALTDTTYFRRTAVVSGYANAPTGGSCLSIPSNAVVFMVSPQPTISCPNAITVGTSGNNSNGDCLSTVELTHPTGTNFCQPATLAIGFTNGTPAPAALPAGGTVNFGDSGSYDFGVGQTFVTYTANDGNGNSASCSFAVTVEDNENPTASCPQPVEVNAAEGTCAAIVEYNVTTNDNCPGQTLTQTAGLISGASFPIGITTNAFVVIDAAGNTGTCSFTVTVSDNQPPTITCPQNIEVNNDADVCGAVVEYDAPTFADNCTGATIAQTSGLASGAIFPIGVTTNTFVVTDANGNVADCAFTVTVNDNQAPVAVCQNITVELNTNGEIALNTDDIDLGSSDNCDIANITVEPAVFTCDNTGPNTVVLTITDINNNSDTCHATVTVVDAIAPEAVCQDIITELDEQGEAVILAEEVNNGSSDNCSVEIITVAPSTFTCNNAGPNFVVLTVTDASNNSDTCHATVTVIDNIPPVAICQNITIAIDENGGAVADPELINNGSTDNCTIENLAVVPAEFLCSNIGPNEVVLTVTDGNNNSDTCHATVTVIDNLPPVALCQNITVELNETGTAVANPELINDGSTDNCEIGGYAVAPSEFNCANVGEQDVVLTVTDMNNNVDTCHATVTVIDNLPPVALCKNITVELNGNGTATPDPELLNNGSSDNCSIEDFAVEPAEFNCSNVGPNEVVLSVIDGSNNIDTCHATITIVDNLPPMALCQNITVELNENGSAVANPELINNGSTDNCEIENITVEPNEFNCSSVGPNEVVLTVTDIHNNVDTCHATVTIVDNIPPVALCHNVTVELNGSGEAVVLAEQVNNGSFDNCEIDGIVVDPSEFTCSNVGENVVTLTVTDVNGNSSTCSAVVIIQDNIDPIALCQNVTVELNENGEAVVLAEQVNNGSSDNCEIDGIVVDPSEFTCSNVGENVVTLTVTDVNGNSSTCSAVVIVQDNIDPIALCQNVTVELNENGEAVVLAEQVNNGSSDNCEIDEIVVAPSEFTCSNVGENVVTLTVTDVNGNSSTCSAVVIVQDNIDPIALCHNVTVELNENGEAVVLAEQVNNGSSDNCEIDGIVVDPSEFTCSNVGENVVTLTVTDVNGNSATCSAVVIVEDNIDPIALCHNVTVELNANGEAVVLAEQVNNGSSDNCEIDEIVVAPSEFTCSNVGENVVTLTVTDVNGNSSTCSAVVIVQDNFDPIALCHNVTVELNENGEAVVLAEQVNNGSSDNCEINGIVVDPSEFNCSNVGENVVTLTVTDVNGNSSTCSAVVIVEDNIDPVALCQNITVYLNENGEAPVDPALINDGSTDNCGIDGYSVLPEAFDCSAIGENAVIFTVTDDNGNTATCAAVVTVIDNLPPVALCQNIIVELNENGVAAVDPELVNDGSTDNCGVDGFTVDPEEFTCSSVGENEVILTVTDVNGNSSTCTAVVTVIDNLPPVALCQNITVELNGSGEVIVDPELINAGSTDNCGIDGYSVLPEAFDCSNVGENDVIFTVTDVNGNTATCVAVVTVEDNIDPIAVCQSVIIELDANGTASVTADQVNNGSSDNCEIADIEVDPSDFTCSDLGENAVTLTVTDVNGNTATCVANVTVQDNISPTALCQDLTVQIDETGIATINGELLDNGSSDNCEIVSYTAVPASFDCTQIGEQTVTLTVTDASGNAATCSATVTVEDNMEPIAICRDITIELDQNGSASITAGQINNGSSDNCEIESITINASSFDCDNIGEITVTLTVTDVNGNIATCSAVVTVEDNIEPLAVCQNIIVELDANGEATITAAQIDNGSTDNCSDFTLSVNPTAFNCQDIGENVVTLTVTDAGSNQSQCTAIVTVKDVTAPVVASTNAPNNPDINNYQCGAVFNNFTTDPNLCTAEISIAIPDWDDNCDNSVTKDRFTDPVVALTGNGNVTTGNFPTGTTVVTFTGTDNSGNTGYCTITIVVTDTQLPTLTNCPVSQTINTTQGQCTGVANIGVPSAQDNCGITSITFAISGATTSTGNGFLSNPTLNVGENTIAYTVSDAQGNQASCSFVITVVDNQPPVITCPAPIVVPNATGLCNAIVEYSVTATDNCVVTTTATPASGSTFQVGVTTVNAIATDASGNTATCSFTVTVNDTQAPVITCPAAVNVTANNAGCTAANVALGTATATDNCSVTITNNAPANGIFPVGTTIVTYIATDASTNTAVCTQVVTVTASPVSAVISAVQPQEICVGGSVTVNANVVATGPWTLVLTDGFNNYTVTGTGSNPTASTSITFAAPGTYMITAASLVDAIGCTATLSGTVNVNVVADPVVSITGPSFLCSGSSATLTATLTGGVGCTVTWETSLNNQTWTPTNITGLTFQTGVVPVGPHYYRAVLNCTGNGCAGGPSNVITLNPTVITAVLSGTQFICAGQSANLQVVINGSLASPFTVEYTANNVAQTPVVLNAATGVITVSPTVNTTYKLTKITDANGCMATGSALTGTPTVGVNPPAVVNAGNDQTVCAGQSILLSGTVSGAATSGTWSTSGTGTFQPSVTTLNATYVPSLADITAGTVTLTLTSNDPAGPCPSATDQMVLTITPPFVATLALSPNSSEVICLGGSATLVLTLTNAGAGPWSVVYAINGVPAPAITATTNPFSFDISPTENAVIELVSITDTQTGCAGTFNPQTNLFIIVNPVPVLSGSVTDVNCFEGEDGSIELVIENEQEVQVPTFEWSNSATTQNISGLTAGDYTVTVTAGNGCTATISFTVDQPTELVGDVTVTDNICELGETGSIALTISGGTPGYTYAWSNGATTADITGLSTGTYTVTVTDDHGCTLELSGTVNYLDHEDPVISIEPLEITVNCEEVQNIPEANITVSDDVDQDIAIDIDDEIKALGNCPNTYTILRTYTATDDCGHTATATQIVNVQDVTPPDVVFPADITIYTDADCEYDASVTVTGEPDASDNCSVSLVIDHADQLVNGQCNGSYVISRTWKVVDDCGNSVEGIQTIMVQDTTRPTFIVPTGITIFAGIDCSYSTDPSLTGEPVQVRDNCTPQPKVNYTDVTIPGNCPSNFSIVRTWTATDDCGNIRAETQVLEVIDNMKPTFTAPADITIYSNADCQYNADSTATGAPTNVHDNCTAIPAISHTDVLTQGNCPGAAVINRTWKVSDACGNMTTATQIITVQDTIRPTFTVPANITLYANENCFANTEPSATGNPTNVHDNCTAQPTVAHTDVIQTGACQGAKTVVRTWTVTDLCSNIAVKTQTITVLDTIRPTFAAPANITIYTDYNCEYDASPDNTGLPISIHDNCTQSLVVDFTDDIVPAQCEGSYVITRTWAVVDGCGNSATHQQVITVEDNIAPQIIVIDGDTLDVSVDYANIPPPASVVPTDNCTTAVDLQYTETPDGGPCDAAYTIVRRWVATDCEGNSSQVDQVISVNFTLTAGTIAANQTICSGATPAPLTSTNAGSGYGTIAYRWESATNAGGPWTTIAGANAAGYAPGPLTATTYFRRFLVVTLPNNITCSSIASNTVQITVNPLTQVAVSITANTLEVCAGTTITFTATVTNGGVNPTYVWKKNGVTVATLTGTNLFTTAPLVFPGDNNAVFTVEITPSAEVVCATPAVAVSNALTIHVNQVILPVLTLTGTPTLICPGETVNFSLAVTNADIPSSLFIWNVNNVIVTQGFGLTTYSSNTLNNGAQVQVTIIPLTNPCGLQAVATSNIVTITHKPQLVPSVTIAASSNPICPGGSITFTASPVNGGATPSYVWKKNNITVGTNSPTYIATNLQTGDLVTVIMTPSAEVCPSPSTATATPVTVTVYPAPVVNITGLAASYCQNAAAITLTGTPATGTFTIDGNAATSFNPASLSVGAHIVQYIATDVNGCTGSSVKTVTVDQLVTANAGPDQTLSSSIFTMAANNPAPGTGMWTVVTGNVTINNPSSPTTTVTIVTGSTATLRWTITNGTCSTFDDVVITRNGVTVQLRAILQGAYAPDQGKMKDNLRSLNLIPTTSPYGTGESTTAAVFAVTGDNAIVDWVKVEIRSAADFTLVLATKSALIQRDGDIVDVDGVSPVPFNSLTPGSYYVSIKHRNHLGILSALPVPFTNASPVYDFTLSAAATYTDPMYTNAPVTLIAGKYCMWGGDVNGNTIVRYLGPSNDNSALLNGCLGGNPAAVIPNVYSNCDLNMNGTIRYSGPANDNSFLLQTVLGGNSAQIIYQHF